MRPLRWIRQLFARKNVNAAYDNAQTTNENKRLWSYADGTSAKSANDLDTRKTLRERSRYEISNSSYLRGIITTTANDLISTGPTPQVASPSEEIGRVVETAFLQWCDAIGFTEKLRTAALAKRGDGEGFLLFTNNESINSPIKLYLRDIECDQFSTPTWQRLKNTNWVDGVELDANGNPAAYHLLEAHPGDEGGYFSGKYKTIPARYVLHWFRKDRPGQVRGIPEVTPALELFGEMRRYRRAVLGAAETAASISLYLKSNAPADDEDSVTPFDKRAIERDMMMMLPHQTDIAQVDAKQPTTTFDGFSMTLMCEAARCLNIPLNVALGTSKDFNFSSARLDHTNYYAGLRIERQQCEETLLTPVFRAWLDEAVMIPGLLPDGLDIESLSVSWHWPGFPYLDPMTDAQADTERLVNNKTKTYARHFAEQGLDWRDEFKQLAEEQKMAKKLGLNLGNIIAPAPPAQDDEQEQAAQAGAFLHLKANAQQDALRITGCSEGFELHAEAGDDGKAKLPTFSMTAYTGGAMNVGFGWPVVVDLEGMRVNGQRKPILKQHSPELIVGHTEKINVTTRTIGVSGTISGTGDAAQEVVALAKNGFPWQASIGASIQKLEFVERGESVKVNGRNFTGPVYVARQTVLGELSFVPMGADDQTSATVAATLEGKAMGYEAWLKAKGFDLAQLNEQQSAFFKAQYDAEIKAANNPAPVPTPTPTDTSDPIATMRAQAATEAKRIAAITAACVGFDDISAQAIGEGWTVERTENAVLKAKLTKAELEAKRTDRPTGPAIHGNGGDECTVEALQGAMILRAGGRLDHAAYQSSSAVALKLPSWLRANVNDEQRQRYMEAAHSYASMSAIDLCRLACQLDKRTAPRDYSELIRAAFSGGSLTNIFTTNVNAILLAAYTEGPDTTVGWVKEQDVADFKTNERPRMTKAAGLTKLPRGSEADHFTRSDVGESYKIARYAKQFVVDDQDMIDDNLSALMTMPEEIGSAARRLRPDLVYAIILANPNLTATARALFNSTDGNALTSAALAADKLRAAVKAMMLFQENGINLNLMPTHIIVPPSLIHLARELVNSSEIIIAGTAGSVTERGTMNALQADGLTPVTDARLENGVVDPNSGATQSGSASTWYLGCANAHTIEVGYRRGTGRAPQVRSFVLSQGTWGIGWDVAHDIGAKALDWKGLVRNVQ